MVDDYGYINARIHAMKSELLAPDFYEELLKEKDLGALISLLSTTSYGEDLKEAETRLKRELDIIHTALNKNLERTGKKILNFSGGKVQELFKIIFARYDIRNLKTILRGELQGIEKEDIHASLVPWGSLDEVRLLELLQIEDASGVLDLFTTWGIEFPVVLGKVLAKAVREGRIQDMEYYLEESFFNWARGQLNGNDENQRFLRGILERMVDMRNLMETLILLKEHKKPLGRIKYLTGGMKIPKDLENAETLEEGVEVLKRTPYGKVLQEREKLDLMTLERLWEKEEFSSVFALRKGDPLGIGVPLAYIWAKETEVINLRIITYGINFNLPKAEIRDMLISTS